MAKIIVKQKAEIIKEYFIQPSKHMITVGSEANNDLVLEDKKISMNHLKIEKIGLDYYLTDLNSAFGTHMRGRRVEERTRILQGDEIKLGDHILIFQDNSVDSSVTRHNVTGEETSTRSDYPTTGSVLSDLESELSRELAQLEKADSEQHVDIDDFSADSFRAASDTVESQIAPEEATIIEATPVAEEEVDPENTRPGSTKTEKIPYYLLTIYGPYKGKKYQLNFGTTKIGRDTSLNDIVIRLNEKGEVDPSISRRHSTITYKNGQFYLNDRRSKTRSFINQKMLSEMEEVLLTEGDEIEIVSDQKSTIFRFVKEGNWDASNPQKCGVWWIRRQTSILRIASIALTIFSIFIIFNSLAKRSVILQKPGTIKISEAAWLPGSGGDAGFYMQEVGGYNIAATPGIADVNGDNILDFIYFNDQENLRIINGQNRKVIWGENLTNKLQSQYAPVLADLNGNNKPDVIVITNRSQLLSIDGTNGAEIWTSQILGGPFSGSPVISDLNCDGFPDVALCTEDGKIHIGFGNLGDPAWIMHDLNHPSKAMLVAVDITKDNRDEIIFGTEDGLIIVFDANLGQVIYEINVNEELNKAKGTYNEDNQIRAAVAAGDLNADQVTDIIITTRQGNILAINGSDFRRMWYDVIYQTADFVPQIHFAPAMGDFNGDGFLDVVVCTPNGLVRAYRGLSNQGDRAELLWEFGNDPWESFMAAPVLGDLNKDGMMDVITCGAKGGIRIFNGPDGKILWQTTQEAELVTSAPLIGDLTGDGFVELVFTRSDNGVYQAKTNNRNRKSQVIWGQIGANARHTGCLISQESSVLGYTMLIILFTLVIIGIIYLNFLFQLNQRKLKQAIAGN